MRSNNKSLLVVEFQSYFKILYFIIEYCDWWKYDYISFVWFTAKHKLLQVGIHEIQVKTPHTINLDRFFHHILLTFFIDICILDYGKFLENTTTSFLAMKKCFTSISGIKRVYKTYSIKVHYIALVSKKLKS